MILPTAMFCLCSGIALGLLYVAVALLRALLSAGRVLTAVLDVLFCAVSGLVVFLCALAVGGGRLRFFQAGLQLLGGWSVTVLLCPVIDRAAQLLRREKNRIFSLFSRKRANAAPKKKKSKAQPKNK